MLFSSALAQAQMQAQIAEGEDYITLQEPLPNAQNTLIEVYSYACPFCYKYSKILPQVIENLPQGMVFKPYHLEQKGSYGKSANLVFAALITIDENKGVDINDEKLSAFQKAKRAYFDEYHMKKNRWKNGADEAGFVQSGLKAAGVSDEEYRLALEQPRAKELLKEWGSSYKIALVQGIPAFVVNGKYLIKTNAIKSIEDLSAKIKELAEK
ncbi:thiol:disulfide interchange protein [Helicobacter sp. CLO-3]|nr:thiol:disulfide interchange protein [Helicobacter sp. CLO-3]OHU81973.1 thiol:disulfide interchange protein [Helicobacter sp. CLO-3]